MSCIFRGCTCEGRNRANWPMAESPESFKYGEDFDREILASRLPFDECDGSDLAAFLGLHPTSIRQLVGRGRLPWPDHHDESLTNPQPRGIWTAGQVVGIVASGAPVGRRTAS